MEEQAREEAQRRDARTTAAWIERLERAGLMGWLAEARFGTFQARDDWPEAVRRREAVEAYARALVEEELGRDNWLILHGDYGTGKSHLAAAVVRYCLDRDWRHCYFRVWPEYLKRLQASWEGDEERTVDIEEELASGRLVVLDDVDKRTPSGWSREVLFTAMNRRYNQGLPTVLTFNYGPTDADPQAPGRLALEEFLGRATLDRLMGSVAQVVAFEGPSYRSGTRLRVK